MRSTFIAGAVVIAAATVASAQEVTLRAVSAFAEKTTYSRGFELFIERVNRDGKGVLQINYIGGPKAMPPFEVGNALKSGVVDVANSTGAFYTNVMPEADSWKLTERPMSELRKNGGYDYMSHLYAEKMNAIFLARHGYGWPITGIFDLGWHEKTKYRVDPGFYTAEVSILVNKSTWDRLTDAQRDLLRKAGEQAEGAAVAIFAEENAKDTKRQADAGIQTIKLEGADGKLYHDKAYEAGWAGVIRQSPQHGAKLKEFFAKAN